MARAMKMTTDKRDRKDMRVRTERVIESTKDMSELDIKHPGDLHGEALKVWKELVPVLNETGYVKQADYEVVRMLCIQVEISKKAYASVREHGTSTVLKTGSLKANPDVKALDSATAKIKTLSTELGLTPSSRASLFSLDDGSDEANFEDAKKMFGGD